MSFPEDKTGIFTLATKMPCHSRQHKEEGIKISKAPFGLDNAVILLQILVLALLLHLSEIVLSIEYK